MAKCKVCGYRLGDGVAKCPMCGAASGSTTVGNVNPSANLQKSYCASCGKEVLGEHRYCPSCGADLKSSGNTAATHAPNSAQSQRVQPQAQSVPQKQSSTQVHQNSQSEYRQSQSFTQQSFQNTENQSVQQKQQDVVEQKEKSEPNKNAFWILTVVSAIIVIHNAIWQLSKSGSLFFAVASPLFCGAILIGIHFATCLSDSLSKGARKKAIIVDSIANVLFLAIEFGVFF